MAEERLPLLLGLAFGRRMLEGQHEWRDVPEVVRTSFLLLAKELRRLHRLLLTRPPPGDDAPSCAIDGKREEASTQESPAWRPAQQELERLHAELRDAKRLAEQRQARWKRRWTELRADFAAMTDASKAAQQQHAAISQHLCVGWEGVKSQVALLDSRVQICEAKTPESSTPVSSRVDAALLQLTETQATCSQEVHRLQWALAAHDHRVVAPSPRRQSSQQESRQDRPSQRLEQRSGSSLLSPTTLRQRCAQARRKQQQG